MFKPSELKTTQISGIYCSVHNRKTYSYMCLADSCSVKLLCESCIDNHNRVHNGHIHKIRVYLENLFRSENNKSHDNMFSQIKALIENKEETLATISQLHENKERDVLNIFDQLKCEINDTLDVAYQKYCNSLREYHHKKMHDVQRKIHILQNMVRVQTCIQDRSLPLNVEEGELKELVKLFARFSTQMDAFPIDLEKKFKFLNQMLHDESQLSLNLDRKRCESIRGNILDLIREQFDITNDSVLSTSPDSTDCDISKENSIHNQHDADICALVTLKDNFIATAGKDFKIKLWDLSSGECAGELLGHEDIVWDLQAAFDGKYLISASADSMIKVWKVSEKKLKKTLKGHETAVYALEFKEDTKTLISGDQNGSLFLWDMSEGKLSKKLQGHKKAIWSIKKLTCDKIVTGSEDQEIKIWSLKTGALVRSLIGHESCIFDIVVFKGGKQIASGDEDGMIFIWDIEKGVITEKIQAHEKGIRSLAINEKETLIASGGYDHALKLWDMEELSLLRENTSNDAIIRSIKFYTNTALLYCDTNVKNYKFSKL